jgi:membrane protein implicated in regulation of membrane protease activity
VPNSVWFALALIVAGLGNLLLGLDDWPGWLLADVAAVVVGAALLVRAVRRRTSTADEN